MGAVFCAFMMIMLCQVTNAVSYSEQTVTVDYDYQVIDSFEGVDAKYVLGYSDTGYYCCAGYVSRFYEEKFGVTVYNINSVVPSPFVVLLDKRGCSSLTVLYNGNMRVILVLHYVPGLRSFHFTKLRPFAVAVHARLVVHHVYVVYCNAELFFIKT